MGISAHIWIMSFSTHLWAREGGLRADTCFPALPGLTLFHGDERAPSTQPQCSPDPSQLWIRESSCAREHVSLQTGSVRDTVGSHHL